MFVSSAKTDKVIIMMLRFFVYLKVVLLLSFVYILLFYKCHVVIHLTACCLYQAQNADIGIRVAGDGWHARPLTEHTLAAKWPTEASKHNALLFPTDVSN